MSRAAQARKCRDTVSRERSPCRIGALRQQEINTGGRSAAKGREWCGS